MMISILLTEIASGVDDRLFDQIISFLALWLFTVGYNPERVQFGETLLFASKAKYIIFDEPILLYSYRAIFSS